MHDFDDEGDYNIVHDAGVHDVVDAAAHDDAQRPWRPPILWVFLYPFADFDWREKVDRRLTTAEFTPIQWLPPLEEDASISPFQDYPFTLLANGYIRYEVQQVDAPARVEIKNPTVPFKITLPEDLPVLQRDGPMQEPIVSSDGRYVIVRRYRDDKILRAYTYEGSGSWLEWQLETDKPKMTALLMAGLRNYQYIGNRILRRAVVITVLVYILIMLSFYSQ